MSVTITIPIASLRPHPDQHLFDGTLAEADEHGLREDLHANGQRDPIKILADGTILDGHQRARLLGELGHSEVLAIVVELVGDEFEQRSAFISQNLSRRQLSPLQRGVLMVRKFEADRGMGIGEALQPRHWRRVKAAVADILGVSGRHANRVLRILLLPHPVVTAVDQGRLSMSVAEKLDTLEAENLQSVVEEIEQALADDTADINAIVKQYLADPQPKWKPERDFDRLCTALETFNETHGANTEQIGRRFLPWLARLVTGKALLDRLVAQLEAVDPDADPFADLADFLGGDDD